MNNLSTEKRNQLIIAASALAVCAVLWFFVIRSQNENLRKRRESVEDMQPKSRRPRG